MQVEIERLCLTRADALTVPALPSGGALSVTGVISAPTSAGTDVELKFDSLELKNPRGAADFAFLDEAEVLTGEGAAAVRVASLERSRAGEPPAVRLVAKEESRSAPAEDSIDYLLSVSVTAVAAPVTADLEVCARVVGRYGEP